MASEVTSAPVVRAAAISTLFSDESSVAVFAARLIRQRVPLLDRWLVHSRISPTVFVFTITLVLLTQAYTVFQYLRKMSAATEQRTPFPFMDLPPELREMVYENLLEDPHYPPLPPCNKHHHASFFASMMPPYFPPESTCSPSRKRCEERKSNLIFVANKQIYGEYMDLLVKKRTFHLRVDSKNYPHPGQSVTPTIPTSPLMTSPVLRTTTTPSSITSTSQTPLAPPPPQQTPLWTISRHTLSTLRRCSLKLITTSSMSGIHDPRTMPPGTWPLAHRIAHELRHVHSIRELNLHVLAVGDPLWNPLWVWFHASLSFIPMGCAVSSSSSLASSITSPSSTPSPLIPSSSLGTDPGAEAISKGPKLSRISFSLDTWSPGENHLERNEEGVWEWCCMAGHRVGADAPGDMAVREFCARLYMECRTCRPELDSDDEDEQDEAEWGMGGNDGDDHDDDDE